MVHVMGFEIDVLYIVNELYIRRFDQEAALEDWVQEFRGDLGTALTGVSEWIQASESERT
jgi:hypothetical protein